MAIPRETAQRIIESFQADRTSNLFAQSNASHLLYEVGEVQENFPKFDPSLKDKVTISAYSILAAAISIAEEEWGDSLRTQPRHGCRSIKRSPGVEARGALSPAET